MKDSTPTARLKELTGKEAVEELAADENRGLDNNEANDLLERLGENSIEEEHKNHTSLRDPLRSYLHGTDVYVQGCYVCSGEHYWTTLR